MARKEGLTLESKFIRGLITESTSLNFPPDAATETYNCIFDDKGAVYRRKGIDLESGYSEKTISVLGGLEAYVTYVWDYIKNGVDKSFLVCQQGAVVHFFDISTNVTPSAHAHVTTITLTDYDLPGASGNPRNERCQFAQANGYLLIVNRYCFPMYVTYTGSTFTVTPMTLQARDFVGAPSSLSVSLRPITTVSAAGGDYPEHLYNLFNAGWNKAYLNQWDSVVTTLPSRADAAGYFRVSAESMFTSSSIQYNTPGDSPAPNGHFILPVGSEDRTTAMATTGLVGVLVPGGVNTRIPAATGTNRGDASSLSVAFDSNTSTVAASCANKTGTSMYIGKEYSSPVYMPRAVVFASSDKGFIDTVSQDVRLQLYGKNGTPASATDGTLLGENQFVDTTSEAVINDHVETPYTCYWVRFSRADGTSDTMYCAEVLFYEADLPDEAPSCTAFFAGRAWYGGINTPELGNRLYFSQVLDDPSKFPRCYQVNDPASDKFPDLLATDGGSITIPDMNQVKALFNFQSQLLVLATNGVWLVSGGSGGVFAATDYRVRRISSVGITSAQSVVDVKGLPIWWGEDGIYTVQYDANYDSTVVKSLTEGTIKTFFLAIPAENRRYSLGIYDQKNDIVRWCYNKKIDLPDTEHHIHDTILNLNMKTGAFYPWTFERSVPTPQYIRGLAYIQDAVGEMDPVVVYPLTYTRGGTTRLTFGTVSSSTYYDWSNYATLTGLSETQDYSSYFITGYRPEGGAMTHFQAPYVYSYLSKEANSSIYLQGLLDFTASDSTGKWSTPQQAYNSKTTLGREDHDTRVTRLLVRGTGKVLRCKYYSESGKPFTILGWGLYISGNSRI